MIEKDWKVIASAEISEIDGLNYSPLLLNLLYRRGIKKPEEIENFLQPEFTKLHDPFLFNDMSIAVERVSKAIEQKEKIIIYGDYDADGVTSAAVIYKTLVICGANVEVFIPHREDDGYGLNKNRIQEFIDKKISLLITVDCGITNIAEIKFAKENNLEVIVTDHHEPLDELPEAQAIIDPKVDNEKYPCKFLSGAGVAYKLAGAVLRQTQINSKEIAHYGGIEGFLKWLLDLVAIGTIADVVPLLDENRVLAKFGLLVLKKNRRLGLRQLAQVASLDLSRADAHMIGYQLAPRLNAAGRLRHANLAFELLISEDEEASRSLAEELNGINVERQKITDRAIIEAREQLGELDNRQMLFVYNENWQAGIIGLIAGRLCEEFYRPIMVMTKVKEKIVGSGRSIEYFNIVETLFANGHLLSRFGGHAQACGFAMSEVNNLTEFQTNVLSIANDSLSGLELKPIMEIDAQASLIDLNLALVRTLTAFEPFGEANEKPKFLLKNLQIISLDYLGDSGKHLRLMVKESGIPSVVKLLAFFFKDKFSFEIKVGDLIDVVVEVGLNVWNGNESVECKVVDLRKCDE